MILGAEYTKFCEYRAECDGLLHVSGQIYPDHADFTRSLYLALMVNGIMVQVDNAESPAGAHMPARISRVIKVKKGDRIAFTGRVLCHRKKSGFWQSLLQKHATTPDGARILRNAPYEHFDFIYVG